MAGWLAICGIIPFSGFWSKDEILWKAASTSYIPYGWLIWLVGTIAATCTAFYMTRLMAMTFWGKEKFLEKPAVVKQTKHTRRLTTKDSASMMR
jgi:NADH-quinone oxidoreductase subunit L